MVAMATGTDPMERFASEGILGKWEGHAGTLTTIDVQVPRVPRRPTPDSDVAICPGGSHRVGHAPCTPARSSAARGFTRRCPNPRLTCGSMSAPP